jgi:Sigma-70, region 4
MKLWDGCGANVRLWKSKLSKRNEPRLRSSNSLKRRHPMIQKEQWRNGKFCGLSSARPIVFMTRVIEGMSTEETASLLGLHPDTVKTRLHRARRLVRDELDKQIGPVLMDAFPFAGRRCERMTSAVLQRLLLSG